MSEVNEDLTLRVIKSMQWMIDDMKWRYDNNKGNLDEGSCGGYSPELTEAINTLEELKKEACE